MTPLSFAGKRALLLEDDGLIAANTGSDLIEVGVSVAIVATCSDGLKLLAEQLFDFALLDIKLVDETSYELATDLRRRGVPFLFISGYDRARADFADVVLLQKPFSRDALLGVIASLMASPITKA